MATNFGWPPQDDDAPPRQPQWGDRTTARVRGPARLNDPVFEHEDLQPMGEALGQQVTTFFIICASSRHVIHKPEEVGAYCAVCQQALCLECAKHTCAICGEAVCLKESRRTPNGDFCANRHGFFETIPFIMKGRRK